MTDEQKQKKTEANKRYRDNMSDERKQKLRDYQKNIEIIRLMNKNKERKNLISDIKII